MIKVKNVYSGALVLSIGVLFSKLLGLFYRIPLTNILGSYGIGMYQMVFPLYTLLLDFSGSGAPNAISKIIAEKENNKYEYSKAILKCSINLLIKIGLLFSFLMLSLSYLIAKAQGNSSVFLAYIFLSPSIVLVCLLSCFRGYFQGLLNMFPTAISQVSEQIFKLFFGIILTYLFRSNIKIAVGMATLSISISELISLLILFIIYKKKKINYNSSVSISRDEFKIIKSKLIKYLIPISIMGLMIPLSHVIDSFSVVNILKSYREDATSLFGISSGIVHTIIGLPVSLCYSLSTISVPLVSKCKNHYEKIKQGNKTLIITLLFSTPMAIFVAIFAPNIISLLFRRLTVAEFDISVNLLRLTSVNVLLLSLLQTQNGILVGQGKLYSPTISLGVGVIIKTILTIVLIKIPRFNIYGSGIAVISCYFLSVLINLICIFGLRIKHGSKKAVARRI